MGAWEIFLMLAVTGLLAIQTVRIWHFNIRVGVLIAILNKQSATVKEHNERIFAAHPELRAEHARRQTEILNSIDKTLGERLCGKSKL